MEKLVVIKTVERLKKLQDYLKDKDVITFDFETTGLERDCKPIGFSVATNSNKGFYVVISYWDVANKRLVELETAPHIKDFLSTLVGKNLVMANAPYDCMVAEVNYNINLMPSVWVDVIPLGHLLNENRRNGLKERGQELLGKSAISEQAEMKASVVKNGGKLTKECYELYKADMDLIAKYGAKDAILTFKVLEHDLPILYEEGLDKFFFEDETMPLLRGPTYDLNMTGLRVDPEKLQKLRGELEAECLEQKAFIYKEIEQHIKYKYKGTSKANTFNIDAPQQLAWLVYFQLGNEFGLLTDGGKELCKALNMNIPYAPKAKIEFVTTVAEGKGRVYMDAQLNPKTGKMQRPKKIRDWWTYTAIDEEELSKLSSKYRWVKTLLEYKKNTKLLSTYILGIQERMKYNIIRPSFLQHGTTSGRYSSRNPNFQNLPRDDKRIKSCIVSRPGTVFVGADYSQLEPRVFASFSGDKRLQDCFRSGDDFYSVVGVEVFDKQGMSLKKDDPNSFAKKYPQERQIAKEEVALASAYGTTPWNMSRNIGKPVEQCRDIIESYFNKFPSVYKLMLESHEQAMSTGKVFNLFGRPRRMPEALDIKTIYGSSDHSELPYGIRNILNLAMNHRIQSTGASIMNRAAIATWNMCREMEQHDSAWKEVKIVLQVHDQLILEGPEHLKEDIALILKNAMEHTIVLPNVVLIADPFITHSLAEQK